MNALRGSGSTEKHEGKYLTGKDLEGSIERHGVERLIKKDVEGSMEGY
jgi:hypothetical protein